MRNGRSGMREEGGESDEAEEKKNNTKKKKCIGKKSGEIIKN